LDKLIIVLLNVELKVQTKSEENVSLPGKPATSYGLRSRVPLGNVASKLNNNAKGIKTNVNFYFFN
jgi:hypothetical protein